MCKDTAMERTRSVCSRSVLVGSGPEGRLCELRLVQGHWETRGGKGKVLGLQEAQAGLAKVTGWPAVTCGVRHQVLPGVLTMMPGGGEGSTMV